MLVNLILLGPSGHKCYARMGLTLHSNVNDFIKHSILVAGTKCIVDGCDEASRGSHHGWTCTDHDPLIKKAVKK